MNNSNFDQRNDDGGRRVDYTQKEIAAATGMSRVSVSKCLRLFADEGLIEKKYGYLRVIARDSLKEYFYDQEF